MISRSHGLVLSLLLGAASAAGAYAMIGTAKLGNAETKPEVMSSRLIAKRAHKLDSWEVSLQKALKSKPPALTPLNRYAAVAFVSGPGAASMPAVATPVTRAAQQAQPPTKQVARVQPKHAVAVAAATRVDDTAPKARPVAEAEPERASPTPAPTLAPTPAPTPIAAAATVTPPVTAEKKQDSAPASTVTPPKTLTVEQQCRLLEQAAEGKSEQVKQDAEKQCEALKQAAEKTG